MNATLGRGSRRGFRALTRPCVGGSFSVVRQGKTSGRATGPPRSSAERAQPSREKRGWQTVPENPSNLSSSLPVATSQSFKGSVKAGGGELLAIWGKSQRRNANRVSRQLFLQLGGLRGPQVDFMAHEVHQSEADGNRDAASFSAWAAGPPDELCGPTPVRSPSASRTPPHRNVGLSRRSLAAAPVPLRSAAHSLDRSNPPSVPPAKARG